MNKNNPYSPYFYKNYKDLQQADTDKTDGVKADSYRYQRTKSKKTSRLKNSNKRGAVALVIFMICAVSTFLCADYFTSGLVLAAFEPKVSVTDTKTYYAVRLGYFSDKKTADSYSLDIAARAAAGYIRSDNNYSVIAAVYTEKERAEKVVDRLMKGNTAATITAIEIKPFNSKYLNNSVYNNCITALETFDEVYIKLFDLSNALDKSQTNETGAKETVNNIISDVKNKKDVFDKATSTCVHPAVTKISSSLSLIIRRLEEIGKTDYVYPSSPVRYAYTAIVYDNYDLSVDLSRYK